MDLRSLAPASLLLGLLLWTATPAAAHAVSGAPQDDVQKAQRTVERFQAYLERQPFHAQGFERLIEAATELGSLSEIVDELEAAVATPDASDAQRVLLARLQGRTDRVDEALAALDGLAEGGSQDPLFGPRVDRLRGELFARAARPEEGLEALDAAAVGLATAADSGTAVPRQELESLHRARAEAALRIGDRERAGGAFDDLVATSPTSFDLRLDVGASLADAGLVERAVAAYDAALELAGDDVPRRCRALAALGRLHERRGQAGAALDAYSSALELLARGHWLERDLAARVQSVHTREGTLRSYAAQLERQSTERPDELALRERLASAQIAARDVPAARATLAAAVEAFPADLTLGRAYLDALELADDDEARVAEYQRILAEHPRELELYLELGQLLAQGGRLEQARLQWSRTLDGRLDDASFSLRLAALHARFDLVDEAVDLVERAIELEPRELGHYDELVRLLSRSDRRDEVAGVLDRAESAAGDDPALLETLSLIARSVRDTERAGRVLERALASAPGDARVLRALAEHARRAGDEGRASELLRRIVSEDRDPSQRRDAARRLVRLRARDLGAFVTEEEARLEADPEDRDALYLLALAERERRRPAVALEHLEALLALDPGDTAAAEFSARLAERTGDDELAVRRFRELADGDARRRGEWLLELGRLQARLEDEDAARAAFEEALELGADRPATYVEAAEGFAQIGDDARARECLEQVVRLAAAGAAGVTPRMAGDARLELAELLLDVWRESGDDADRALERAEALAAEAARSDDEGIADRAQEWLYERLEERGELDEEIARLRAVVEDNPYDDDVPLVLVDLFRREREYQLALDLLGGLLAYRPGDADLLEARAGLSFEMERWRVALDDYERLLRLPDVDRERLLGRSADCHFQLGDVDSADRVLLQMADALAAARVYRRNNLTASALEIYEEELARRPDDHQLMTQLIALQGEEGNTQRADELMALLLDLDGATPDTLRRKAEMLDARGDRDGYIEAMAEALLAIEPPFGPAGDELEGLSIRRRKGVRMELRRQAREIQEIQQHVYNSSDWSLWDRVSKRAAQLHRAEIENGAEVRDGLLQYAFGLWLGSSEFDEAAQLLSALETAFEERSAVPVGKTTRQWRRILERRAEQLVLTDPERAAARASELVDGDGPLTEARVEELADLYRSQEQEVELMELYVQASRDLPEEARYRAAAATMLMDAGEFEEAVQHLRALPELRGVRAAPDPLRVSSRDERKVRERLEEAELDALEGDALEALTHRLTRLEAKAGFDGRWGAGSRPRKEDTQLALARALAEVGEVDEARALLASLEPEHPEHVSRALLLGQAYLASGFEDDAQRLFEGVRGTMTELLADPVARELVRIGSGIREFLADAVPARGDVDGYMRTRRFGGARTALAGAKITYPLSRAPLREALQERWRAAVGEAGGVGAVDAATRDLAVAQIELALDESEFEAAGAVVEELLDGVAEGPFRRDLELQRARLAALLGDHDRARELLVELRTELIEEVQRRGEVPKVSMRNLMQDEGPGPLVGFALPDVPLAAGRENSQVHQLFDSLREMQWMAAAQNPPKSVDDWVPWEVELALIESQWIGEDWGTVAERLEVLFKQAGQGNWAGWQLGYAVREAVPAEESAEPLYRLAYDETGKDEDMLLAYGDLLEKVGRGEDALREYRSYLRQGQTGSYQYDQVEARVKRLAPGAGGLGEELPADLEGAVASDPRNLGLRRALVERLLDQGRYAEAGEHAETLAQLGAHLGDVRALCAEAYLLAGDDEAYIEEQRALLRKSKDDEERARIGVVLAGFEYAAGRVTEAEEVLKLTFGAISQPDYTSAPFWIQLGEKERAIAALRQDIEDLPEWGDWYRSDLEEALARLGADAEDSGFDIAKLDEFWSQHAASNVLTLDLWYTLDEARRTGGIPDDAAQLLTLADEVAPNRAPVLRLLASAAEGDEEAVEEQLVEIGTARRSDPSVALVAVARARERGEFARAAELLERIAARRAPSARKRVGPLTERQLFEVELASLRLAAAGEDDPAARAACAASWAVALADEPAQHLNLLERAGFTAEALELLEGIEVDAPGPELSLEALDSAARLALETGDLALAAARLELLAERTPAEGRDAVEARRLAVARARLSADSGAGDPLRALADAWIATAGDGPSDPDFARRIAELVLELDGVDAVFVLALGWKKSRLDADFWTGLAEKARALAADEDDAERRADRTFMELRLLERAHEEDPDGMRWDSSRWRLAALLASGVEGRREPNLVSARELVEGDPDNRGWRLRQAVPALRQAGLARFALEVLDGARVDESEKTELVSEVVACHLALGEIEAAADAGLAVEVDGQRTYNVVSRALDTRSNDELRAVLEARLDAARKTLAGVDGSDVDARVAALRPVAWLEALLHRGDDGAALRLADEGTRGVLPELARLAPGDAIVRVTLIPSLTAVGRYEEARRLVEEQLEHEGRLAAVGRGGGGVNSLRQQRARLVLRVEGTAAALDAISDQVGRRFVPGPYRIYELDPQRVGRSERESFASESGLWDVAASDEDGVAPEELSWWEERQVLQARLRGGLTDEVLGGLLKRLDAAAEEVELRWGEGLVEESLRSTAMLFVEAGREAELLARADGYEAAGARELALRVRALFAEYPTAGAREDRDRWRVEYRRFALHEAPSDPVRHEELAAALLTSGDGAGALEAASAARELRAASLFGATRPAAQDGDRWESGGGLRFAYAVPEPSERVSSGAFVTTLGYGGSIAIASEVQESGWSEFGRGPDVAAIAARLAAVQAPGDAALSAQADALEAERVARADVSDPEERAIAEADARRRLADAAEDYDRPELDAWIEGLIVAASDLGQPEARARGFDTLQRIARRRGDAAGVDAWRQARRDATGEERSDLERALVRLEGGAAEEALEKLEDAYRERLLSGHAFSVGSARLHGLGQALAATGNLEGAQPVLRQALSVYPASSWAPRSAALLE